MKLLVLTIASNEQVEDALSVFAQDNLNCLGVESRRRSDFERAGWLHDSSTIELAQIKDLPASLLLYVYFDQEQDPEALKQKFIQKLKELKSYGLEIGAGKVTYSYIQNQDWQTVWQKFYHPIAFSRHLAIVPAWEKYQPQFADQLCLRLNPGLAFGTGNHQTTQLSLMALERVLTFPKTVVDVGTGSGILAIAAELMGAKRVLGTDISAEAMSAAQQNAALNGINDLHLQKTSLLADVSGQFDVIVANILAEILLDLIPQLNQHLAADGKVIFSGIDYLQLDKIKKKLAANNFKIELEMHEKRWVGLIISRTEN